MWLGWDTVAIVEICIYIYVCVYVYIYINVKVPKKNDSSQNSPTWKTCLLLYTLEEIWVLRHEIFGHWQKIQAHHQKVAPKPCFLASNRSNLPFTTWFPKKKKKKKKTSIQDRKTSQKKKQVFTSEKPWKIPLVFPRTPQAPPGQAIAVGRRLRGAMATVVQSDAAQAGGSQGLQAVHVEPDKKRERNEGF